MKTFLALILSCGSVWAADTSDLRVVTTTDTHTQPGILITLETYTRGGQTNLVRDTRTRDGVLTVRRQTFYHDGVKIGGSVTQPAMSFSYSVPGMPYTLSFQRDATNHLRSALISSNSLILEAYSCSNDVFYPHDSAFLQKVATNSASASH